MEGSLTFFHGPLMHLLGSILYRQAKWDKKALVALCTLRLQNKSVMRIINRWFVCAVLDRVDLYNESVLDRVRSVLTPEQHSELIASTIQAAKHTAARQLVFNSKASVLQLKCDDVDHKYVAFCEWAHSFHLFIIGRFATIHPPPSIIPTTKHSRYWRLERELRKCYDILMAGVPDQTLLYVVRDASDHANWIRDAIQKEPDLKRKQELILLEEDELSKEHPLVAQLCGFTK